MPVGKNILLIDDDADDRELFCEALEMIAPDFLCHTALNGKRAVAALAKKELAVPDLIFLDINMPMMNGWQFISFLKQQEEYREIPVIMYSTSSHPEDLEKARQAGAFCFFSKPHNFNALKKSLELAIFHLKNDTLHQLIGTPPFYDVSKAFPDDATA
jgi:CheY-like chemotaxis protein